MVTLSFRQAMSWLHTWTGLLASWLLYFMFITGSAGYFEDEIDRWMKPEIAVVIAAEQAPLLALAEARLALLAPEASDWYVVFPTARDPFFKVSWSIEKRVGKRIKSEHHVAHLHPASGEVIEVRETAGGQTLYRMHYALHYMPKVVGYWLSSIAAVFMLLGLLTGVVIHRKIFVEFFTFRPAKKQRSWLDMHNLLSVLPLPFHLMITYSGLVLLMFSTMQGIIAGTFGVEPKQYQPFIDSVYDRNKPSPFSEKTVNPVALKVVLPVVEQRWGKEQIAYIGLRNRASQNAYIEVQRKGYDGLDHAEKLNFNALNGELKDGPASQPNTAKATFEILTHLHEGVFADMPLRWLYFLSGLMGAGMIASGLILWLIKKRSRVKADMQLARPVLWFERINLGVLVGLLIAIAAYFWANRLLPLELPERANWEVHVLFIAWGLMLLHALLRPLDKAWLEQLGCAALAFGLLPVLNGFTSNKHLGMSLQQGDWIMAGFDLTVLFFAACFAVARFKLARHWRIAGEPKHIQGDRLAKPSEWVN